MPPPATSRPRDRRGGPASPAAAVLAALFLALAPLCARAQPPSLEYAVKANFLYKFGPFVEWPPTAFASARSPFAVCVFGEDPFGAALDDAVRGQTVDGHPVVVRRLERIDRRPDCNVLFVGPSRRQSPAQVLELVKGTPILTVTDEGQSVRGGIVHFVVQRGRVRFSIDDALARRCGLALSSKLLSLAVPTRGGEL